MKLQKKDLLLLYELDKDSRASLAKTGRRIGLSQQLVDYKIKSMVSNDQLSFFPLIDFSRLGYLSFKVFFKIKYTKNKKLEELISKLITNPNISEIVFLNWRYELQITFLSKNPSSFNKTLREIVSINPSQLKNFKILTSVVSHHHPREYLLDRRSLIDKVVGGDREVVEIDELNRKILYEIVKDARISVVEIARRVGTTTKTVIYRLRSLEQLEIIKGYKPQINVQELGFFNYRILVKYHNISVQAEERLRNYCLYHPNIIEFTKFFGEWDLELNIECKSRVEFRNLYTMIREEFEDIIEDSEALTVRKIYERKFVPDEYFN